MPYKKISLFLSILLIVSLLLPALALAGPFNFNSQMQEILKEASIAQLQQSLQQKGSYTGPLDGNLDSIKDNALQQVKDKIGVPTSVNDLKSLAEAKKNQLLEEGKNKLLQQVGKKIQLEYVQANYPKNVVAGQSVTAQLIVKNTSKFTWQKDGQILTYFTYRWLDASGQVMASMPEGKVFLPQDIKPGELVSFNIQTTAPQNSGKCTLQVNIVQIDSPITKIVGIGPLNMSMEVAYGNGIDTESPVIVPTPAADNALPATGYTIQGRGFGHGVGLSQWGARGMALQGFKYQDIIKYYYQGTAIQTFPTSSSTIRVGIYLGQPKATITSTGSYQIVDQSTQTVLYTGQNGDSWQIVPSSSGVQAIPKTTSPNFASAQLNQSIQSNSPINGQTLVFKPLGDGKLNLGEKVTTYRGSLKVSSNLQGKLDVINLVNLEDYLFGVVTKESHRDWPMEALKAQAVASRSYALYKMQLRANQSFDVYDTTTSQVYGGFNGESPEALEAVLATAGQVGAYNGKVIEALFYANSGGYTESNENYWKGVTAVPYLRAVKDPYSGYQVDPVTSRYGFWWQKNYTAAQLESAFNVGKLISMDIVERYPSGRPSLIKVTGSTTSKTYTRTQFMGILDPNYLNFKSGWFELIKQS